MLTRCVFVTIPSLLFVWPCRPVGISGNIARRSGFGLPVGVVDLELGSGVGDEGDQEPGPFRRAGVLREDVVSTRLLDPVLAWAESSDRFVVELTAHGAVEDVGVDESLAVPVRRRACAR